MVFVIDPLPDKMSRRFVPRHELGWSGRRSVGHWRDELAIDGRKEWIVPSRVGIQMQDAGSRCRIQMQIQMQDPDARLIDK